jgi:Ni/Fe-hydrogenase 1 B-type cytochrome subunit
MSAALPQQHLSVYTYEAPVRIWHWVTAALIVVLSVTGYFIGAPLPTQPGEASANYLMGYIRFAHFAAGYLFAIALLGRIYWALVGNSHSRELFWVPIFTGAYWKEVWETAMWYALIGPHPKRVMGRSPLARLAMFLIFLLPCLFMIITGFALYAEGTLRGSWADRLFGWVTPLFGQSQDVHTWHHLGMWIIICFMLIHMYLAIREDIMGKSTLVDSMISGYQTIKE